MRVAQADLGVLVAVVMAPARVAVEEVAWV